jgi:tetratricopeptide (TPR) repeat protein
MTARFAALLMTAAPLAFVAAPALAKDEKAAAPAAPSIKPSKPVLAIYQEADKLQKAGDSAGALAKINTAAALPNLTPDDQYVINAIRIQAAQSLKDYKTLNEALGAQIATGKVPPADELQFRKIMGQLSVQLNDYPGAITNLEKVVAANPKDFDTLYTLAELHRVSKSYPRAMEYYQKAIDAKNASGAKADEDWYRRMLRVAVDAKMTPQVVPAGLALVKAYPTPVNWRDAILVTRDTLTLDDQGNLDVARLQAATNALNGERDFYEYADTAMQRGFPGESQKVLNDGISKNMLSTSKPFIAELKKAVDAKVPADKASLAGLEKEAAKNPKIALGTADAYYGYGDYAKAAALYKQANGGGDPDTVNLRLGASLARSGDKAGAMKALSAVKAGPRATLAQYWMAWLDQQG